MSSAAPAPESRQPVAGAARTRMSRMAESAVARARLSVVPRRRTPTSRVPFLALVTAILVAGVVGLLLFNTSMQQASFRASSLEDRAAALTAQEEGLSLKLERLRDPQRVAERAQALGMVLPTTWCILELTKQSPTCTAPAATAGSPLRLEELPPVKPASLDPKPVVKHTSRDTDRTSPNRTHRQGRNGHQDDSTGHRDDGGRRVTR